MGDYTASAIASVCYGEAEAAVDGNVFRVLARIFGISTPINTPAGFKVFKQLAQRLMDHEDPGNFNQALIEFGSEQCRPRQPLCPNCIFKTSCKAYQQDRIAELPVKKKGKKIRKRHFNYLVMVDSAGRTYLEQRKGKGIWEGLYEFPLVETSGAVSRENLINEKAFRQHQGSGSMNPVRYNPQPIVHKLTHQHIHTTFWICCCEKLPSRSLSREEVNNLPVPVLIEKFIGKFEF